jgi:lipopolysaccharide export system permease protein
VQTLNSYIFRRVVYACFMGMALFTVVLLMGQTVKNFVVLLSLGYITWFQFFGMMGTLLPLVISWALPLGMLTGILLVLGKLSSQNEITAMRCAGISLWRISAPIFAIAILGVTGSVMINNYYAPNAYTANRAQLREAISRDPMKLIVAKTFIRDFPRRVLYIGEETETELRDFWIWQLDDNRNVHQLVRARRGEFHFDDVQNALILTIYDGYAENRDKDDPDGLDKPLMAGSFKKAGIKLPLDRFLGRGTFNRKLDGLNFNDLLNERERILNDPEMEAEEKRSQVIRVQTQVQKNFAMAYSVLAFAFLAIPLGIKVGRGENYANILVALGLAFVWYFCTVIVEWLEKNPALRPDLLIWLPNIAFQIIGFILFKRISGR